jgi:hypothetical protein
LARKGEQNAANVLAKEWQFAATCFALLEKE